MPTLANLQVEWARTLLDGFARAGVTDVVVSPGSRSTPFVLAAVEHPSLTCHDVIDERVAAFFALGQARASGRPSLLLCTSGTAATHYFPAIAEASVAYVPMVVLTTDRPSSLFAAGESQTIDQLKLFGSHVRFFADLGAPTEGDAALYALRRFAAQAVSTAHGPVPGPTHLNARAVRPLEPPIDLSPSEAAFREHAAGLRESPFPRTFETASRPSHAAIDALVLAFKSARRPLVVAGHAPRDPGLGAALDAFATATRVPVFAEAASQARFGSRAAKLFGQADAIFRAPAARASLAPDLVVQVGGAPIAKGLELLASERPCAKIVVSPHGFSDPSSRAALYVHAEPRSVLRMLTSRLRRDGLPALDVGFSDALGVAEAIARSSRDAEGCDGELPWSEGLVARELVSRIPDGGSLALGNSLSIREVDAYADPAPRRLSVFSQRGASGIDGLVAGFAGAMSKSMTKGALLVGDVSFLHDAGGLAALRLVRSPAVVVVVNNGGGRIFEQLPIAAQAPELLRHFTTPHDADLSAVAGVYGVPFARATTRDELASALEHAFAYEGGSVIEAVVPPHGATEQNRARFERVAAALAARFSGAA